MIDGLAFDVLTDVYNNKANKFINEIAEIEVQNSPKDKPYLFNTDEEHLKF